MGTTRRDRVIEAARDWAEASRDVDTYARFKDENPQDMQVFFAYTTARERLGHAALTLRDAVRFEQAATVPTVVCLCGSTRFYDAFQRANFAETMAGRIVLSVGFYSHSVGQAHGEMVGITPGQKVALDELHKRKIDLADEVLILNVDDYVGSSTRGELAYARAAGKRVRWLLPSAWARDGEAVG